jgi:hypothetical protein
MQQIGILLVRECVTVGSAVAQGDWQRRAQGCCALRSKSKMRSIKKALVVLS